MWSSCLGMLKRWPKMGVLHLLEIQLQAFELKVSYAVLSFSSNHVFDRVNICIQPIEILWSMLSEKENGILTFSMYIDI